MDLERIGTDLWRQSHFLQLREAYRFEVCISLRHLQNRGPTWMKGIEKNPTFRKITVPSLPCWGCAANRWPSCPNIGPPSVVILVFLSDCIILYCLIKNLHALAAVLDTTPALCVYVAIKRLWWLQEADTAFLWISIQQEFKWNRLLFIWIEDHILQLIPGCFINPACSNIEILVLTTTARVEQNREFTLNSWKILILDSCTDKFLRAQVAVSLLWRFLICLRVLLFFVCLFFHFALSACSSSGYQGHFLLPLG